MSVRLRDSACRVRMSLSHDSVPLTYKMLKPGASLWKAVWIKPERIISQVCGYCLVGAENINWILLQDGTSVSSPHLGVSDGQWTNFSYTRSGWIAITSMQHWRRCWLAGKVLCITGTSTIDRWQISNQNQSGEYWRKYRSVSWKLLVDYKHSG
mgnify:CR=1 FL=1